MPLAWIAMAAAIAGASPPSSNMVSICNSIASGLIENNSAKHTDYVYQTKFYDGAGVSATDSLAVRGEAVRRYWLDHRSEGCVQVSNRDLLKLAVLRKSEEFIEEAVGEWRLDLNFRDPRDGSTVLDYISQERTRMAGTPVAGIMDRYYRYFRQHGAKHASEL